MTKYDSLDAISFICSKLGFEVVQQMHADSSLKHGYAHEWHRILCCGQPVLMMPCERNAWFTCGKYNLVMEFATWYAHDVLRALLHTRAFRVENCNSKRIGNPFYGYDELEKSKTIDEFKVNFDLFAMKDWSTEIVNGIRPFIEKPAKRTSAW